MKLIKSRITSLVPGDTLLEMVSPVTDVDGRVWPAGTAYRPLSAGRDGLHGYDYQEISVGAEIVRGVAR